jgi:uncharacterized membrane protein YhiD involved in acid resistance
LDNLNNILSTSAEEISIYNLIINLFIGFVLSVLIQKFYTLYGNSTSNRSQFSKNFSIITLVTILVITIVKSSLALSLGLVGALSIVRFRTPIKDPEELSFLFFSIGVGLGLGANQTITTILSTLIIITFLIIFKKVSKKKQTEDKGIYLNISVPIVGIKKDKDEILKLINNILKSCFNEVDLNRVDFNNECLELGYSIRNDDINELQNLIRLMNKKYPKASINLIDQKGIPAI